MKFTLKHREVYIPNKFLHLEEVYVGMTDEEIIEADTYSDVCDTIKGMPTVEAIPKDNVYQAVLELMKYEHEGFINISLVRFDEILKKYGVCEDGKID